MRGDKVEILAATADGQPVKLAVDVTALRAALGMGAFDTVPDSAQPYDVADVDARVQVVRKNLETQQFAFAADAEVEVWVAALEAIADGRAEAPARVACAALSVRDIKFDRSAANVPSPKAQRCSFVLGAARSLCGKTPSVTQVHERGRLLGYLCAEHAKIYESDPAYPIAPGPPITPGITTP